MKKFIIVLLVFFSLFIVSCDKKEKNKKEEVFYVTLLDEEGTTLGVYKLNELGSVEAPLVEGHTFTGWVNGAEVVDLSTYKFSSDITLTATYMINKYQIQFFVDDSMIQSRFVEWDTMPETPTYVVKDATDEFTYTFEKWDKEVVKATEDAVYHAVFKEIKRQYTYQFVMDDDKFISGSMVNYGEKISVPKNPTKASNAEFSYEFIGWDKDVAETVTEDVTYKAVFKENKRSYTYKFVDYDNTVLKEETVLYGSKIVAPADPTRSEDVGNTYTFSGWDKTVAETITGNVTYKAQYEVNLKKYNIKFVDDEGKTLQEGKVAYGTMPALPSEPTKEGYKFNGWTPEVVKVSGDATYTATFVEKGVKFSSLEGLTLSILGDSISTFYDASSPVNSYYSQNGRYYYPIYSSTIKTVDLTWWYQLYTNTKMKLGVNNSWSGSCAYEGKMQTGEEVGSSDARMNTIDDNGTPDVFIVYLGTNDIAAPYDAADVMKGIELIASKAEKLGCKQIFFVTLGYSGYESVSKTYKNANRVEFNRLLRAFATENEYGIIPLDEYVVEDNYSLYLGDNLHYNAKGAALLSLVAEKAIKEYNGIEFTKEIKVEHQEVLPEGVLGKIEATASSGFWTGDNYAHNVFLEPVEGADSALFSLAILITKNNDNDKYYVTNIIKSNVSKTYSGDYVLIISDSHENAKALIDSLNNVVVGAIVEFDDNLEFPQTVTFLKGDGNAPTEGGGDTPTPPPSTDPNEGKPFVSNDKLHIGAFNTGVWTVYGTRAIFVETSARGATDSYLNFNVICVNKTGDNEYTVTGKVNKGTALGEDASDAYILIYGSADATADSWYESINVGQKLTSSTEVNAENVGNGLVDFSK